MELEDQVFKELIGEKAVSTSVDMVAALLARNTRKINAAYQRQEKDLTVNLSLKFTPRGEVGVRIQPGISFTESKVKESGLAQVINEAQKTLPGMGDE